MPYKQSQPNAQDREIVFHLTDQASGLPKLAQTFATTDLQIRKPGAGAYVNCNAAQQTAVVEIGGGDYVYTFTPAELDTPGPGLSFKANKAACLLWTTTDEIARAVLGKVIAGTLTPSAFTTDRGEAVDDFWKDALIEFVTGALAGQVKKIGAYNGAAKRIMLATGLQFTAAPAATDIFEILNR